MGFDITVASEVMAILCLANDLADLEKRLGDMIVAYRRDRSPVYCRDIKAEGAMAVLLKDAMQPNLVQTLENNPAFVHGGPFANIAHGCNSVVATKTALKLADYVVTEAGFGADLGAEKFMNIKCRKAGLRPSAVVIVATVRAMKMNGGVAKADLGKENVEAVKAGCANLGRHIENMKKYGVPAVVGINHFSKPGEADTDAEIQAVKDYCASLGVEAILNKHWAEGGAGIAECAQKVVDIIESGEADYKPLYPDEMSLADKISAICTEIYRADAAVMDNKILNQLKDWEDAGLRQPAGLHGENPVHVQRPTLTSAARRPGFDIPVREVRLSAGAGFVVAICGEIMTMPGLPRVPAAETIRLNDAGRSRGPVLTPSLRPAKRPGAAP